MRVESAQIRHFRLFRQSASISSHRPRYSAARERAIAVRFRAWGWPIHTPPPAQVHRKETPSADRGGRLKRPPARRLEQAQPPRLEVLALPSRALRRLVRPRFDIGRPARAPGHSWREEVRAITCVGGGCAARRQDLSSICALAVNWRPSSGASHEADSGRPTSLRPS